MPTEPFGIRFLSRIEHRSARTVFRPGSSRHRCSQTGGHTLSDPGSEPALCRMAAQSTTRSSWRRRCKEVGRAEVKLVFVPGTRSNRVDLAQDLEPRSASLPVAETRRLADEPRRIDPGAHPPLHVRHLHRRAVEPICPRRLPRRRRNAVAFLQPALHSRRRRSWQDALDARHRPLRRPASPWTRADLHLVGTLHERDDQCGALRSDSRFSIAVSQRRRAARGRHPIRLGQGRHAERVLPHLQRAARCAEADRHQQRPSAP